MRLHNCYKSSPNVMAQIFISYRRHDTAYVAATLNDKLQQHFGPNSVFFDVDNIPLGVDFREHIGNAVGQCDVLLVIIGDQWLGPLNSQGKRRIDDPSDYVRIEIESALKRNIPIIPVLVEEATMPAPADLPDAIQSLAFRNAAEIRAGRDLRQHIEQLIVGLEAIFKSPKAEEKTAPSEKPGPAQTTTTANEELPPAEEKLRPSEKPSSAKGRSSKKRAADTRGRKTSKPAGDPSVVLEEINKALKDFTSPYLYVGEAMPLTKLNNALGAYAPRVSPEDVLLFFDNTVFGGGKDGLLLTSDAVYWHNITSSPGKITYDNIQTVEFVESTSFFAAANILINQAAIELSMGEKNKLVALANAIRNLADYAKREHEQLD